MNELFLDIETIPAQSKAARDFLSATVKPPATIKLEASIKKWHEESKEAAIDDAVAKTGLDGALGQVVCVGYQFASMDKPNAICGMNERDVLLGLNAALSPITANMHSDATVVGHNVAGFDLRFLLQRYIVNGIKPHPIINHAANAKAWDNSVFDTMLKFAGYGNRISLDKLCFSLGIEGKSEFTWEDVLPSMLAGKFDDVATYCKHDVSITKMAYERMQFRESA